MTLGTLRDQVIYPDTLQDHRKRGITDGALEEYLKMVRRSVVSISAHMSVHVHLSHCMYLETLNGKFRANQISKHPYTCGHISICTRVHHITIERLYTLLQYMQVQTSFTCTYTRMWQVFLTRFRKLVCFSTSTHGNSISWEREVLWVIKYFSGVTLCSIEMMRGWLQAKLFPR